MSRDVLRHKLGRPAGVPEKTALQSLMRPMSNVDVILSHTTHSTTGPRVGWWRHIMRSLVRRRRSELLLCGCFGALVRSSGDSQSSSTTSLPGRLGLSPLPRETQTVHLYQSAIAAAAKGRHLPTPWTFPPPGYFPACFRQHSTRHSLLHATRQIIYK